MKKTSVSMLAAVAAFGFASTASAQICAGFPTNDGQFSLAAVANFPEDTNEFGVEGSYNLAGPLALNAAYLNTSFEFEGEEIEGSANTFVGGLSFDVTSLIGTAPATISLCPTAQLQYTTFSDELEDEDGDLELMTVPVGLGFGTSLPVGVTAAIQPYVIPQIVFQRANFENLDGEEWENEFGLRGGANLVFGQFFIGGEVNKIFVDGSDAIFGVKAGIRL